MKPLSARQRTLLGALAVTLALSLAAGQGWLGEEDEPPLAMPRPARAAATASARAPAAAPARIELERLQPGPRSADPDRVAAFGAMSWQPPPAPPPRPAARPGPPPPPTAPPLPFSYLGRYEEGGQRLILLVRGERLYTVSEGEVIDNTYRVERLAGGQLELTYLPLGVRQVLSAGGA